MEVANCVLQFSSSSEFINLKAYSGHDNPQFIEGHPFKTIIPLNDDFNVVVSDRINDRINDRIKSGDIVRQNKEIQFKLNKLAQLIYMTPLLNTDELASKINVSVPTVNRYLKTLKLIGVSELKGSRKSGGYVITQSFESEIENAI